MSADELHAGLRDVEPRPGTGVEFILGDASELLEELHVGVARGDLRVGALHEDVETRDGRDDVVLGLLELEPAGLRSGRTRLIEPDRRQIEKLRCRADLAVVDVEGDPSSVEAGTRGARPLPLRWRGDDNIQSDRGANYFGNRSIPGRYFSMSAVIFRNIARSDSRSR